MIDHNIILAIACENINVQELEKYVETLENFVANGKNVTHPDYYDAEQHLSRCYNYLAQIDHLDKNIADDRPKNSYRHRLQIPLEELERKLLNLSYQNLTNDKLEGALLYLADEAGTTAYNLKQYYESIKTSEDRDEFLSSIKSELDLIADLEAAQLDLTHFLPPLISNEIIKFATKLKISPACCLTALITSISTCCKIGTQLEINAAQGFFVSPYQFAAIVAESGCMKSVIFDVFARDPLAAIQKSLVTAWKEELKQAEAELADYNASDPDEQKLKYPEGPMQVKCQPRALYIGTKTMEGILYQFEQYPDQPLAYMKDELAGLFLDADKYRGGKGSEAKDIMSMHGGTAPPTLLKNGGLVTNPNKVGLNIFGTIQPEVLQDFWSDATDPDGYWSRFLYCYQTKTQKEIELVRSTQSNALPGMLEALFRSVYTLPPNTYKLCDYGYEIYATYYNHLGEKAHNEPHPGLAKAYSKALGLTGRLILMLHIIDGVYTKNQLIPDVSVNYRTVIKGIDLMSFYLKQRRLLDKKLGNSDSISPELLAINEASKRLGSLSARDIQRYVWQLRDVSPDVIRSRFHELVEIDCGEIEGKGNRIKYRAKFPNPRQLEPKRD